MVSAAHDCYKAAGWRPPGLLKVLFQRVLLWCCPPIAPVLRTIPYYIITGWSFITRDTRSDSLNKGAFAMEWKY